MNDWLLGDLAGLASPWAYVVVGVLAAGEAVFAGLLLPGELALLLGGFLAFTGHVSLPLMVLVATAAALVGPLLGYEVGRWIGPALRRGWVGRRIGAARWEKVETTLARYGGRALLFGRFVSVLRSLLPFVAGASRMPYRTFLLYTAVGGLVWGPGFVLLGYAAGHSYQAVAHLAGSAGLVLLVLLAMVVAVVAAARWAGTHRDRIRTVTASALDLPWVRAVRWRFRHQLAFLARRLHPGGALGLYLTLGLLVIVGCGWAFGKITEDVLGHEELAADDSPLSHWLVAHRTGWLTAAMQVATALGSAWIAVPATALATALLTARGDRRRAVTTALGTVAGAAVLVNAIKLLIGRDRPDFALMLVETGSYSFPSGHAAQSAAACATIAYFAAARWPQWGHQVTAWAAAVLLALLVGFSRIYLGAHWFTDVLGGYALGLAWTTTVITTTGALHRLRREKAVTDA
ncbi:bifunctional DedA family/phosphatase PAP2 family protein [Saccharopolyspora erythraea]|uniref:bifunctional DedA family/phosphatase PAP2 family protein n=1 Tax=Saccharopolyspora erythraea TaxID=1836 RepID=UPI001BA51202|nr:bifunctional DedA family/phosphatase PAP2 family protein [Saccharopolyspora erythraea]QUH03797.1 bifunctional DedA family/phosphatase PAP2 family protein [Saccharopolyspora erythraea]